MSGTDSSIGNGTGSGIHQPPSQNSMPLAYSVYAMAPPLDSTESPSNATLGATYRPDTGNSAVAAPVVQPSIGTYQPVAGDSETPVVPIIVNNSVSDGEVIKRKRGRPKKYAPDGSMVTPAMASPSPAVVQPAGQGFSAGKRGRGRPRGSCSGPKKQHVTVSGPAGVGFTPNIITVKTGEDLLAKLMSFSQHKTQAVCILSANGAISNVTLQQASSYGGTVNYEGRFEILSLSGSFLLLESGGQRSRTGGLNVSLAGPDGCVLGGVVAGLLIAASPVQVIVGSFNVAGQRPTKKSGHSEIYPAQPKLVSGASVGGSPSSRATLSESSGGPGSPLNHSAGGCNNSNSQTIPNLTWR